MIVTENQLDDWVRGNAEIAQGTIVELIWRLVAASCPSPKERRFPLGDSLGQPGPDGVLDTSSDFEPFVPGGRSFWEIGCGLQPSKKATADYRELTKAIPEEVRRGSTFVFVTPLSGRRGWPHTWKHGAQGRWLETRRAKGDWKAVRIIDGTKLVDWMTSFPAIDLWLAERVLKISAQEIETVEARWELNRLIGSPPPLSCDLFLADRAQACAKVSEVLSGGAAVLRLETRYPNQVADFVAAYVASLPAEQKVEVAGTCLLVASHEAWGRAAAIDRPLTLIADSPLDLDGDRGTRLLQMARRQRHSVIYGAPKSGIPDPSSTLLVRPRETSIQSQLSACGYPEQRASKLARNCDGNLSALLRAIQNLSLLPGWATGSEALDLAYAQLLGSWTEAAESDQGVVEGLTGKAYGEWIATIRSVAMRAGTPLTQRDGVWRFSARYEGWYALGRNLFEEDLNRLCHAALAVLGEANPALTLPAKDRYMAPIVGKVHTHSAPLRQGLAETLALLGAHPRALASCKPGLAVGRAAHVVRQLLDAQPWERWASLDGLLPLLGEAAPAEFLHSVDRGLTESPSPFDELFAQETSGIAGRSYLTGLLWALETIAWDPEHLGRSANVLARLAERDPGGSWANRPAGSLSTILQPWYPQTCAPQAARVRVVTEIVEGHPSVGWPLALSLLPQHHATSMGTRKPAWRDTIPEDWSEVVTHEGYNQETGEISSLAVKAARGSGPRLVELSKRLDSLSEASRDELLGYLESPSILEMSRVERDALWDGLAALIAKHQSFAKAKWAYPPALLARLQAVADKCAPEPQLRHRRLFSYRVYDLTRDEEKSFEEAQAELERLRVAALREVGQAGFQAIIEFSSTVEVPSFVGSAFALMANQEEESQVLPSLLESTDSHILAFVEGYTRGRFFASQRWEWVDSLGLTNWNSEQITRFLVCLPFKEETWMRARSLLPDDAHEYWARCRFNPFDPDEAAAEAARALIRHGRPYGAIRCIYARQFKKEHIETDLIFDALMAAVKSPNSSEEAHETSGHELAELIAAFQKRDDANADRRFAVEWAYLSLLDGRNGLRPTEIQTRIASDPEFFVTLLAMVFRGNDEVGGAAAPSTPEVAPEVARNAYELLDKWTPIPGTPPGSDIDPKEFDAWLNFIREQCSSTGHLAIALTIIGKALTRAPPDPDGLWIHRTAARALDEPDAEEMRRGYYIQLFNSRGVYWADPEAKEEQAIAQKYEEQANLIDSAGFHRVAGTLRELARRYRDEADERISKRYDD